nr:TonB-dependent receptor [Granulicella sp. L56]
MLVCQPAAAQSGQGFVGHIEDISRASIAGATVTVHNEGTAEDTVVKTTGTGDYTVPYLKTGTYTITALATAFKAVSKTHLKLNTDQNSKIDFTLPVGSVNETVTVNSAGSQIELSKADRGEIIDAERVQEMPTDGRNVLELFELSPGTINNHNSQFTRPQDNVSADLYANGNAVASAPVQQNLDGATNDNASGFLGYPPPLDSVAEFKVVLNPYDASYGRAGGGAIDISLKSGANKLHGNMYDYIRRPFLDAQSYQYDYNVSQGATGQIPTRHKRDQFGLELDGPVYIPHVYNGKDKTFFLIQWEQAYEALPSTSATISSIPDPKWLTGDFSTAQFLYTPPANAKVNLCGAGVVRCLQPLKIYDPNSPVTTVVDPLDGKTKRAHSAFAGNIIPMNRLNGTGLAIAQFYSQIKPNYNPGPGNAPFQNNYYYLPIEYDIARNGLIKIDHNFGPKDRGTIRWEGFERYDTNLNNGIPSSNLANQGQFEVQPKDNNFSIDEIHTFSPNLILDNKLTLLNEKQGKYLGSRDSNILPTLALSQHYIDNAAFTNVFPNISVSNPFGLIGLGGTPPIYSIVHNLAYQPSITLSHGRHTIRAGYDMRLSQFANPGSGAQNQSFSFANNFTQHFTPASGDASGYTTGSGLAAMLLGDPNGAGIKYSISPFYSQHYFAFWGQDDWKVTPKLTLNLGIRYDILMARTERHNKLNYAFDFNDASPIQVPGLPLKGGIRFAGVNGAPRGAYATNWLNIQPRVGIAYAFSSRTSLRAGFGEMFINDEGNDSSNGFSSSATGYTNSVIDPRTDNTTPYGNLSDPFPAYVQPTGASLGLATTPGSSVNFKAPHYQVPSLWEYSVSVEQLLTPRDVLDISYSGTRAYNLVDSVDFNHVSAAWNARCDVERTGIAGSRQNCDATTIGPAQVANPFKGIAAFSGTSYFTSGTLSTGALTRPYPQFTSVTQDSTNLVHSWYNSLQVSASHNVSKSLSVHAAYTWSKTMKAGQVIDIINGVFGRSVSANDTPNVVTFSSVFYLPVGRGKSLLGNTNRLVDAVVGGWEISPLYVYTAGKPWSPGNNWETTTSNIGIKAHDLPADGTHSYKRLQGVTPCVAYKDNDTGETIPGPSYVAAGCSTAALVRTNTYAIPHNIVYWGVRTGAVHEFDASLSKRFAWNDKLTLQTRLDAFNVLNHPNWTNGFNSDPTSIDWGTVSKGPSGPGTPVRDLQISGKLIW